MAVLPFENLGAPEDEYFAEGVTDELRGKLAVLPGLLVIASTSSNQYKKTIVNDLFEVKTRIATQVAGELDVALSQGEREHPAAKPTSHLAAYHAYLRGNEAMHGFESPAALRRAIDHYERAVALDLPSAHLALAACYGGILGDWPRALEQFTVALLKAPQDAELLTEAARAQQATGRWEEARTYLRRAQQLDPRSTTTARRLTHALLCLRRHPEAHEAADKGLSLAPESLDLIERKAMVFLARAHRFRVGVAARPPAFREARGGMTVPLDAPPAAPS